MFNLFHTKSRREILQEKYDRLMSQVFELEFINIKAAEERRREAQQIMMEIVEMERLN